MDTYFNRYTQKTELESVYGGRWLKLAYETFPGRLTLHAIVKRLWFSRFYGWRMNQSGSKRKIAPFIEDFDLDESEFKRPKEAFKTFNEFFYRKLRDGARPINGDPSSVVFPADGRHLGFADISKTDGFFVKGQKLDLTKLLLKPELIERFKRGTLIISRLCPVDYHRFHFPCHGYADAPMPQAGPLFSVNPIALRRNINYLAENKRHIIPLHSPSLGLVLIIPVGATCVGSMHYTHEFGEHSKAVKGEELGYFSFGGSTILTLFQPDKVELASDLAEHSRNHQELYAHMGDIMAKSKR